ncbi:MAG: hypothetical protein AMK69_20900 [Nitrospira bacterium SG8_3]|nr:MAG: hypothetical protein AMK69_20900 [Nitrospira bacterium SG8_3]
MALACWEVFGLKGYARVDFRVDDSRQPWILEVKANPCLSPDAGFPAAVHQAGIPFTEAVRRILEDALVGYCRKADRATRLFALRAVISFFFDTMSPTDQGSGTMRDRRFCHASYPTHP